MIRYGAELVFCTPTPTGRKETADKIAADTGGVIVHPYDNDDVIAGQVSVINVINDTIVIIDVNTVIINVSTVIIIETTVIIIDTTVIIIDTTVIIIETTVIIMATFEHMTR